MAENETPEPELDGPPGGVEIARVFVVGEDNWEWELSPDVFEDPGAWGDLFAEMTVSIADELHKDGGSRTVVLEQIRTAFLQQLAKLEAPQT